MRRRRRPLVPSVLAIGLAVGLAACGTLIPDAPAAPAPPSAPSASPSTGAPASSAAAASGAPASGTPASPAAEASSTAPAPPTGSSAPAASPPRPSATPTAPGPRVPALSARVERALQAAIDDERAQRGIPGLSATIILPDGTAWTGVSGLADAAARRPVTPDTAFAIASISKTFVAALALELSADGAFGLEDPVARYLPERKLDPAITVRMLLDHTSGLQDYFLNPKIDRALQAEPARGWGPDRALGYVMKPYFAPGTGWHYSNTNYLLLGLLVERATGHRVADEIRARFLDPLDLAGAWYQSAERPQAPLAHGYRLTGSGARLRAVDLADGTGIAPFRSVVTASGAAGSVAATSVDVARWARALYGGSAIEPESLSLMLSGVDRVAGYQPRIPYGLGVQAVPIEGHRTFGHSGRFLGFRSVMRWLPDESVAIAVLTNQSREDPGAIAARLIRILLPPPGRVPAPIAA